jgi:hypothetical protein
MVRGHPRLVTVPTGHGGSAERAPTKRKSIKRGRVEKVNITKRPRVEATVDAAPAAAGVPDIARQDSATRPTTVVHFIKKLPGTPIVQLGTGVETHRCRTQNTANRATDGPSFQPDHRCADTVACGCANSPGPSDPDRLVPVTERTPKGRTHRAAIAIPRRGHLLGYHRCRFRGWGTPGDWTRNTREARDQALLRSTTLSHPTVTRWP